MSTKIPLATIIAELIDSMDRSSHYFRRMYRIGMQAHRKFNYDLMGQFKSVLLPVSANGTVYWPCDYLTYSMIGVINNCGEAVPLKHNEQLSTLKQAFLAQTNSIQQVPEIPSLWAPSGVNNPGAPGAGPWFWLNYFWGDVGGYIHLYGVGGGAPCVGEFVVDEANKCFYVPNGFGYTALMLEYLSDGFDPECTDYMVDLFAVEAIKDYIRWESMRDLNKKYSLAERSAAKQQYLITSRDARTRINHAYVREMEVTFRENVKLTAKA